MSDHARPTARNKLSRSLPARLRCSALVSDALSHRVSRPRPGTLALLGLLLSVGLIALWHDPAHADASVLRRPALHWVRTEAALDCVDPRMLAEHVEALVGPVLVRASEAEHSIEGRVDATSPGHLRVRVRVLDALGHQLGERLFEQATDDCADLTPAIVFVIAMVIDPDVAAHGLPPALVAMIAGGERPAEQQLLEELEQLPVPEPVEPRVSEPPVSPPPPPPPPVLDAVPEDPPAKQLSLVARTGYGEAPRILASLDARFLYDLPHARWSLLGYLRGGRQLGKHDLERGRGLSVGVLDVGAAICAGQSAKPRWRFTGCLGAEWATALVRGSGFEASTSGLSGSFGVVAQLTLRLRLRGGWGLLVLTNIRAALRERAIVFADGDGRRIPLRSLPPFSGGVGLGPSLEF